MASRHIYFALPENQTPTGGVNVAFVFTEILEAHGNAASVHFETRDYVYEFTDCNVRSTYSPNTAGLSQGIRDRLRSPRTIQQLREKMQAPGINRYAVPRPEDLIVIPEYIYHVWLRRFPNLPHVILAQDVYSSITGVFDPIANGLPVPDTLRGIISTSRASAETVDTFFAGRHWTVPLFLEAADFRFHARKKKQIAILPRKRRHEVASLMALIRHDPRFAGYEIVVIEKVTPAALLQMMADALIFLSFSKREGFGLPPAEAMAMGCLTIGYTGIGGREYFDPDYAFPVPDDDIVALFRTLVDVVQEYDRDPTRLDAMRAAASQAILSTYTKDRTTAALLNAFAELGDP